LGINQSKEENKHFFMIVGRKPFDENSTYISSELETKHQALENAVELFYRNSEEIKEEIIQKEGVAYYIESASISNSPITYQKTNSFK
jgi:hypothetical protein